MANLETEDFRVPFPESDSRIVNDCTKVETQSEEYTVNSNYVWRIQNFDWLKLQQSGFITSDIFYTSDPRDDFMWRMSIEVSKFDRDQHVMCVRILLQDNFKEVVDANYSMCILDKNDARTSEGVMPTAFSSHKGRSAISAISVNYLRNHLVHDKLLPDGHLNILCQIKREVKPYKCGIPRDLGLLFDSAKLSDVTLVVKKIEFSVHRSILAGRSPVFASMFDLNMIESKKDMVEIPDIEPEVIKELLRFIYTDKVENIEVLGLEIFIAADQYALEDLKFECENALCSSIDTENAGVLLKYADIYGSHRLKSEARKFLFENAKDVAEAEGYDAHVDGYLTFLMRILPLDD
ncbi:speckle-type POZ protein-like [Nasonia vitripennis]|uniref:BTB domain-containing protein n=1 Tax=Nasonia vitripennis TaxID=7425 RepID=A0A7M7H2F1_NASVI|nr:speckle-type POZ protein-like [Nasonia vitripennis]XP_008203285.1 speckle-type POZ protein-like [Nasonia vitripennis]XP_008203286.1 speckle-type POZ protein-like [Nasonia vitripennis]XP_008203287.1 speckle-type POZ protein-like [Nasonia vitripennis]XP_008203288.1 speckle-type POZ protein-like [Nasonia vitripennis]XP_008203291.1 speckle-type POZ protein-like [Nasonia vitripennis]XP_008203292.1 speckle-type POZ protein-like [Nasonia vitripennis]XP_008203293.1 speckle-type POZ protein-like [